MIRSILGKISLACRKPPGVLIYLLLKWKHYFHKLKILNSRSLNILFENDREQILTQLKISDS